MYQLQSIFWGGAAVKKNRKIEKKQSTSNKYTYLKVSENCEYMGDNEMEPILLRSLETGR